MMGGCSSHNGNVYMRGTRDDWRCWQRAGGQDWSPEDVLRYYKKSEDNLDADIAADKENHATGGPLALQRMLYRDANVQALLKVFKESGLREVDLNNGASDDGFAWVQTTTRNGRRVSSDDAFLPAKVRARNNLFVVTGAVVRRVLIDPATKRATAVEYVDSKGNSRVVKARKEVVLSAGAFKSPHLLMVSGVGPAKQLQAAGIKVLVDLPEVGRRLQDHIFSSHANPVIQLSRSAPVPSLDQLKADAQQFIKGAGPLGTAGPNSVVVRFRSRFQPANDRRPYIQAQFSPEWRNDTNLMPLCDSSQRSKRTATCYYNQITTNIVLLHSGAEQGRVELNKTDPFGNPDTIMTVLKGPQDVRIYADGIRQVTEWLTKSRALKALKATVVLPSGGAECSNIAAGSQEFFECLLRTTPGGSWGHATSTCSIGTVLDGRLRVKGVLNLRVADASSLPCGPSGNTNGPAIMVGERVAAFIKEENGARSVRFHDASDNQNAVPAGGRKSGRLLNFFRRLFKKLARYFH